MCFYSYNEINCKEELIRLDSAILLVLIRSVNNRILHEINELQEKWCIWNRKERIWKLSYSKLDYRLLLTYTETYISIDLGRKWKQQTRCSFTKCIKQTKSCRANFSLYLSNITCFTWSFINFLKQGWLYLWKDSHIT